ncbi:hypothetical protein EW145_g2691 [Phellinidium pouzarii]|uniref:Xyloglucanase n=1 Tax=Phellinidium pouzarii TaxID=167371 RepID=A0A4S4LBE7_9AGAM|nr:hypothetical protein EW145_g2691 [Phellinidium pouzarii]
MQKLRKMYFGITAALASVVLARAAVTSQPYVWKNVKIGGGGGFVPDIVFNPIERGLAFARTDIGGAYRLNSDDSWTPLTDFADDEHWDYWGTDALATDPVDPDNLYIAVGMYTNSYDPSIFSASDNVLYLPYANGIGPWDGTAGYVMKYFVSNNSFIDITPAQGIADNSYGYSGMSVDHQNPGTLLLAPFNEYYPDANIMRSTDGGFTWSQIYTYGYPPPDYTLAVYPDYNYNVSLAPWITTFATGDTKHIGWGIQGLAIDPFDSNHWLYGTGLTIYGGHDLTNWDAVPRQNVTVASLADGVEETAVQGLTAPPSGPILVSAVGDVGGFVHTDLTTSPPTFSNPIWPGTASDVDHAGANPSHIVRLSGISGSTSVSVANSSDGGATWTPYPGAPSIADNVYGGKIAMSASGNTLLWTQASGFSGVMVSKDGAPFTAASGIPNGAIIASDKLNNTVFYAASGADFFISVDGGSTFKQVSVLGSATGSTQIAASPFTAGEFFVSTSHGVWHSTNYGANFTGLGGPTQAWSIAAGKGASASGPPALFAAATIGGLNSLYRTDDLGANWAKLPTVATALSQASGMVLAADPNVYSQVFVGTNGRGIFVGHA